MIARIYDVNVSGYMETEIDSIESLADTFGNYRGVWHDYTGEGVIIILDDPTAHVFLSTPDEYDPYPDWIIESDAECGGYTWYEA